jgi:hypothetical protein
MRDPTDLIQQDLDAEAQRLRDEQARKQEIEDIKWLMAHRAGRRIVWGQLAEGGLFRNPFNNSGSLTAFNCGELNAAQRLFAKVMEHVPDSYVVMLKEHKE